MAEIYTVIAFFAGLPLLLVGWIWSIVVAKDVNARWLLAMIFVFVLALPAFSLLYWQRVKWPFMITTLGMVLLLGTLIVVP